MGKFKVSLVFTATVEADDREEAEDKGFKAVDDILHEPQLALGDIFKAEVEEA